MSRSRSSRTERWTEEQRVGIGQFLHRAFVVLRSICLSVVEEGPWTEDAAEGLSQIRERLYDAVEVATTGKLAERFPESEGNNVCIRLDCYDLPTEPINSLFQRLRTSCERHLTGPSNASQLASRSNTTV